MIPSCHVPSMAAATVSKSLVIKSVRQYLLDILPVLVLHLLVCARSTKRRKGAFRRRVAKPKATTDRTAVADRVESKVSYVSSIKQQV